MIRRGAPIATCLTGRGEAGRRRLRSSPGSIRADLPRARPAGLGVNAVESDDPSVALLANDGATGLLPRHPTPPRLDTWPIHRRKMPEDPTVRRGPRSSIRPGRAPDFLSALGATRTPNLLIRSQMLYPLSYERSGAGV